jgi:hypothetical protein
MRSTSPQLNKEENGRCDCGIAASGELIIKNTGEDINASLIKRGLQSRRVVLLIKDFTS